MSRCGRRKACGFCESSGSAANAAVLLAHDVGHHPESRRLAHAIRAEKAERFVSLGGKAQLIHGGEGAEPFCDPFEGEDRHGPGAGSEGAEMLQHLALDEVELPDIVNDRRQHEILQPRRCQLLDALAYMPGRTEEIGISEVLE